MTEFFYVTENTTVPKKGEKVDVRTLTELRFSVLGDEPLVEVFRIWINNGAWKKELHATGHAKAWRRNGRLKVYMEVRRSSAEALVPALVARWTSLQFYDGYAVDRQDYYFLVKGNMEKLEMRFYDDDNNRYSGTPGCYVRLQS